MPIRRAVLALLVLVGTFASVAPAPAAAADLTISQARTYLLGKINTARTNLGLSAVVVDSRVQDVAQARSDDMAANHYFAHLSNSQLAAMFTNRGINWSKIGEILGENDYPTLTTSADTVMQGWRSSSTHWSIITDGSYGYAGVGVAKDSASNDWIWTVEFAKEAASVVAPSAGFTAATAAAYDSTHRKATVTWSGSPGTYSIKDYRLQYRLNGGSWQTLLKATTRTSKQLVFTKGKTVEFRIRARDVKLNSGSWSLSSPLN